MARPRAFLLCLTALAACSEGITSPLERSLFVDIRSAPGGDGSKSAPFQNLGDAVNRANEQGGATIRVAPGRYETAQTIRIQSPVAILGSNVIKYDVNGWPTGEVAAGSETRIVGTSELGTTPLILVSRLDARIVSNVTIAALTLDIVPADGVTVLLVKAQDFHVRDNILLGPSFIALNMSASSGQIIGNYITGTGCGICVGGGNTGSPATVEVKGNRVVRARFGGVLLTGSGVDVPEFADQLDATIVGNDLSDNLNPNGTGFGIRLFIIRRDLGAPQDTQSTGHIRAAITRNRLVNNQIGIILDGGFPYRRVGTVCDVRTYAGTIAVTLNGNTITGSTRTPALVTFTRSTAALTQSTLSAWQYLHNTTFTVTDPDRSLAGYWLDHPTNDPFLGPCASDQNAELLTNRFLYNGVTIGNARNLP